MIKDYDVEAMVILFKTNVPNFLKKTARYEAKLLKEGSTFTKDGKGKKAIYHIELNTGIKYKCPLVMEKFEKFFLGINGNLCFQSEKALAKLLLGSESQCTSINIVRNDLISLGQFIAPKDQTHFLRVVYKEGIRVIVETSLFNYSFINYYFNPRDAEIKELKLQGVDDDILFKEIGKKYWQELVEKMGGIPAKVKAKEPTELFYTMRGAVKKPFGVEDKAFEKRVNEVLKDSKYVFNK